MTAPTAERLRPALDEDSAPFWAGCARGELLIPRCDACARLRFPPRPLCPWCRSFDHTWSRVSGRGTVWSVAVPHPPLLPAYGEVAPYNVVVVTLEEDATIRLVGNVVAAAGADLDSVDPHRIAIGDPVEVVFSPVSDDIALPQWVIRTP